MDIESDTKYGAMTGAEVTDFLSGATLPMRLALETDAGLLVVPLWFHLAAGRLWACSLAESLVIRSLRERPQVGFDVSTNDMPYRGVRGRGRADCVATDGAQTLDVVLTKYVDDDEHSLSRWLRSRADQEVAICIEPSWITSWDFTERMQGL